MVSPVHKFLQATTVALCVSATSVPAFTHAADHCPSAPVALPDRLDAIAKALNDIQKALGQAGLLDMPAEVEAFYDRMITHYEDKGLFDLHYDELDEAWQFFDEPKECRSIRDIQARAQGKCIFDEIWKIEAYHQALSNFPLKSGVSKLASLSKKQLHETLMGYGNYVRFLDNAFPGYTAALNLPQKIQNQLNLIDREMSLYQSRLEHCPPGDGLPQSPKKTPPKPAEPALVS